MSQHDKPSGDADKFADVVRKIHRRINPCFMTGKGCVHTEHIDSELQSRKNEIIGFNVRPFQPNVEAAHRLSVERFFKTHYSSSDWELRLGEADKVRRTGYVVCERICRRIQSSDFVIVDISAPNANVFYELGLAFGIDHKILVIYKEGSDFGLRAATCLKEGGCRAFSYKGLDPIRPEDLVVSNYLWTRGTVTPPSNVSAPTIVLLTQDYGFLAWAPSESKLALSKEKSKSINDHTAENGAKKNIIDQVLGARDISLSFETHVKASIGVGVDNIVEKLRDSPPGDIMQKYIHLVSGLKSADQIKRDAGFQEVRQKLEQSFCTIIQTGGAVSDPMAYFWLGYCHALGKNVIPVTVIESAGDDIDDLAFDLRALWHMSFIQKDPARFSQELEETLQQMIKSDFFEWSRRQFWDEILGKRGKVSIFTGALHNAPIGREMIGDWDLRAASEMTSYFASHQYRATIESPVYQIEQVTGGDGQQSGKVTEDVYIAEIQQMLRGKNCIVIASPDVNPLTEILLGKLYGVDDKLWFKSSNSVENHSGAVVAFKEVEIQPDPIDADKQAKLKRRGASLTPDLSRAFFRRIPFNRTQNDNKVLKRGFLGHGVKGGKLEGDFLSQTDEKNIFSVHAHLVVARNPFDEESSQPHHVVILNGVSGPATFALTHVLTGGTSTQFVAYNPKSFLPQSESEGFLQQLNQDLDMLKDRFLGLQYFFTVEVGPAGDALQSEAGPRDIFDWRRIHKWERVAAISDCAFGQGVTREKPSLA
jgi:hypothetical protein